MELKKNLMLYIMLFQVVLEKYEGRGLTAGD